MSQQGDVTLFVFYCVCGDYIIIITSHFLRCKSKYCSAKYKLNENSDCPIGQVLEFFHLPADIFPLPRAIRQALVSNIDLLNILFNLQGCHFTKSLFGHDR